MNRGLREILQDFAEQKVKSQIAPHTSELPDDFSEIMVTVEASIDAGSTPGVLTEKGLRDLVSKGKVLVRSMLMELREYLCTSSERYDDVRRRGKNLTELVIAAVAIRVADTTGVSIGAATAAVGYGLLLIGRIGVRVFCKSTSEI